MFIEHLHLTNFKNLRDLEIEFSPNINCITGENGSGKTNILDAIHYLCLTKSAFNISDQGAVNFSKDFFRIAGLCHLEGSTHRVSCAFGNGSKKILRVDDKEYEKLSDHVGRFPVVFIAPDDTDLITEGGETRRKFFDGIICQLDHQYLHLLLQYNYLLKQRNALLKKTAESQHVDKALFEPYNHQLLIIGKKIHIIRKQNIEYFKPVFLKHYQFITSSKEVPDLFYQSELYAEDFDMVFAQAFQKDIILQRTTKGIHTDDYLFEIGGQPIKKTASQGQKKSYVISLKMAHFELMAKRKKIKPILLLDDIFDKLDDHRIARLIEMVSKDIFGQIFVTDARPERSKVLFEKFEHNLKTFLITNGQLISPNT